MLSRGPSVNIRNHSAKKPLRLFTGILNVKNKTTVHWVGADKSKRKVIISGSMLWSSIQNRREHTRINK